MATISISVERKTAIAASGAIPVFASVPLRAQIMTASGTSTINADGGDAILITTDTHVYVDFGATPDPAASPRRRLILAGSSIAFGVSGTGEKVGILLAA